MVVKFRNTVWPTPPQLSLHRRAALSSNSNGTRFVYSRENPKSRLYCEMCMIEMCCCSCATHCSRPLSLCIFTKTFYNWKGQGNTIPAMVLLKGHVQFDRPKGEDWNAAVPVLVTLFLPISPLHTYQKNMSKIKRNGYTCHGASERSCTIWPPQNS
jgi:hypothetical protein